MSRVPLSPIADCRSRVPAVRSYRIGNNRVNAIHRLHTSYLRVSYMPSHGYMVTYLLNYGHRASGIPCQLLGYWLTRMYLCLSAQKFSLLPQATYFSDCTYSIWNYPFSSMLKNRRKEKKKPLNIRNKPLMIFDLLIYVNRMKRVNTYDLL